MMGGALGFATGFAGGKGSGKEMWDKTWKGAVFGGITGGAMGGFSAYYKETFLLPENWESFAVGRFLGNTILSKEAMTYVYYPAVIYGGQPFFEQKFGSDLEKFFNWAPEEDISISVSYDLKQKQQKRRKYKNKQVMEIGL